MFSTSALYFSVAIFGERIETNEAHGLQLVEGQAWCISALANSTGTAK